MAGKQRGSLLAIAAMAAIACAHTPRGGADVYGYSVRSSNVDPVVVDRAPRVYFRGSWARLVDGQWLYPTDHGWVMFTEEPPELARHRDSIGTEQTATIPSPRGPSIKRAPGAGLQIE